MQELTITMSFRVVQTYMSVAHLANRHNSIVTTVEYWQKLIIT